MADSTPRTQFAYDEWMDSRGVPIHHGFFVRDVRNLQLPQGTANLKFMDIAATVNPATVHFRSLTEPSRVSFAKSGSGTHWRIIAALRPDE